MKKLLTMLLTIFLTTNLLSYDDITKSEIEKTERLVVVMSSESCSWCGWFQEKVLESKDFIELVNNENITIKVLEESKSKYPNQFKYDAIPYVFIFEKGKEKDSIKGYLNPNELNQKIKMTYGIK